MTHQEALAEVERLRALVATFDRQQDEIEALIDRWRQEREETAQLVHRMGERLATYEAGHSGPRAH